MRGFRKWLVILLGGLLGLLVVAFIAVYAVAQMGLNRTYNVQVSPVAVPTDAAAVERGKHIAIALAKCGDCHGPNLAGMRWIDNTPLGTVITPNLTKGQNSATANYTDADWTRTIRHGVKPDGKAIQFMPSEEYYYLSDADLGDLIAYLKALPSQDGPARGNNFTPLGLLVYASGQLTPSAATINHTAPRPAAPPRGATVEYGQYLATTGGCRGCHKPDLVGGPIVGAPPDVPPAPNLTPGGELRGWSDADIVKALRQGVTPSGRQLNEFMPWKATAQMTDDEMKAVILYVRSVPAK